MSQVLYTKAYVKDAGTEDGLLKDAIITAEVVDREGDTISLQGLDFKNFERNPLLLWSHNQGAEKRPPIGKVEKIWQQDNQVHFTPRFDMKDPFAADIWRKFKEGFLNAFSIGFIPQDMEGQSINKAEVLEFSAVNIPANPEALVVLRSQNFEINKDFSEWSHEAQMKTAIPASAHADQPLAPVDATWDGPKEVAAASGEAQLRSMHAWIDSAGDPAKKSSYKLPHARTDGTIVFRGVASAMAALMGARGGVQIPDADRRGVYNHLSSEYKRFNKQAPSFKSVEEQILRDFSEPIDIVDMAEQLLGKELEGPEVKIEDPVSPVTEDKVEEPQELPKVETREGADEAELKRIRRLSILAYNSLDAINQITKRSLKAKGK